MTFLYFQGISPDFSEALKIYTSLYLMQSKDFCNNAGKIRLKAENDLYNFPLFFLHIRILPLSRSFKTNTQIPNRNF